MGKKGRVKPDRSGVSAFDLWDEKDEQGRDCTTNTQQGVKTSELWDLPAEMVFQPKGGPRRRARAIIKPNLRPAVAVPHAGQSFNPEDAEHQEALVKAVRKLEKQKEAHAKFATWMAQGRSGESRKDISKLGGGIQTDRIKPSLKGPQKMFGETAVPVEGQDDDEEEEEEEVMPAADKKRAKRAPPKKKKKLVERQAERRTRGHRRHPDRAAIEDEMDDLPLLLAEEQEKKDRRLDRLSRRLLARSENLQTKKFGRHIHHPLPLEVQPTGELVSNLRHVKSGIVHPAQDRLKSLEERNLIPARMRHTYNKRKVLKSKGEVMIRREPFGTMPDSTDRH